MIKHISRLIKAISIFLKIIRKTVANTEHLYVEITRLHLHHFTETHSMRLNHGSNLVNKVGPTLFKMVLNVLKINSANYFVLALTCITIIM